jgi:hypothetical protein
MAFIALGRSEEINKSLFRLKGSRHFMPGRQVDFAHVVQLQLGFVGDENCLISHWQWQNHILNTGICLPIHDRRLSITHTVPRDKAAA